MSRSTRRMLNKVPGSMLGYSVTSEPLELAFYAVAGGAIL